MENEQLVLFEGQEVKVRTDKGETLINLANTARVCGITKTANSGNEVIKWKNGSKGVYGKLEKIRASLGCTEVQEQKYIEEIDYILDEIENGDDRNVIFMSRYLTSRLAMECYSPKANEYKSWLAQLDESYSNGQLQVSNQQLVTMISNTVNAIIPTLVTQIAQTLAPTLSETKKSVENMRSLMHDQATIYDAERNEIKSLIGFHDANTKRIVNTIKDKLKDKFNINVYASNPIFQRVKREVFKEFNVVKWESIPVQDYIKVFSFVDTYIDEMENKLKVI